MGGAPIGPYVDDAPKLGFGPEKALGPELSDDCGMLAQHAPPVEFAPRRPQDTSVAERMTIAITRMISRTFFKDTSINFCAFHFECSPLLGGHPLLFSSRFE
jgi:hypothetical protein